MIFTFHVCVDICGEDKMKKKKNLEANEAHFFQLTFNQAHVQKQLPVADQGARAFQRRIFRVVCVGRGGYMQSSTVSSENHFEIDHVIV